MAPSRAAGAPVVTSRWSARRPPVADRIAAATSSPTGSTVWVAPKPRAAFRLSASGSTARIGSAPAIRAAWMAPTPTPPHPTTMTASPRPTRAVLVTAPDPVRTPHPSSEASIRSKPSGRRTTWDRWTTTWVAKAATFSPWGMRLPSASDSGLRSFRGRFPVQATSCPFRQARHSPQVRTSDTTTGSWVERSCTPSPTSATRPDAS